MPHVELLGGPRVPVGTIYCIGRNYAAHAAELGNEVPEEPVVFLKAAGALRGLEGGAVAFPSETFHHETELVVLLGQDVPLGGDPGWSAVAAVAVGLDLTRRQVQAVCKEKRLPWTPSKSFAGSATVGPFVARSELVDPGALGFSLEVEGELRQQGDAARMLFDVPTLLRHLASLAPLYAGDLVFTGTPEGVGPLRVGDRFRTSLTSGPRRWDFHGHL